MPPFSCEDPNLITITTSLARQLRAIFRRALRLTNRDVGPELVLCAGVDGLRIRAQNTHAAVEHHTPGGIPSEQIRVPLAMLADCEGTKAEPVFVEQEADGNVVVQWTDRQIPQAVRYDRAAGEVPAFPATPVTMAQADNRLWRALADATLITDSDSIRFATDCLQLRGTGGKIVATNCQQLLVQAGFSFPWDDDVLVPRNSLFTYRELPTNVPLFIGRSDKWLTLKAGPWTFHLAIDTDRKFPRTEEIIQRPETAVTRLTIAPADAEFLADAIERLPCEEDDMHQAVTLDLNGKVIVRARASGSKVPTELVLNRSSTSGEDIRLTTNRNFLARAVKLGFRELYMYGAEVPLQACDENRTLLWALLGESGAIQPNPKAIQIESRQFGDGQSQRSDTVPTPISRRANTMVKATTRPQNTAADEPLDGGGNGSGSGHGNPNGSAGPVDPVELAEALRATLRTALGQVSELVSALKQQKRNTRSVQSALATLRQLEKVAL